MEKLRAYAQSLPITFESWIFSFVGIAIIRTFFEQFSSFQSGHFVLIDLPTIVHYGVSYLAISVTFMCILMFFGKIKIQEASAIGILGSSIILLTPIIDLATGGIGGHQISYFFLPLQELLFRFLTFFGGHINSGATLGIQVETVLGVIFSFIYVRATTKNIYRAVGAGVAFYCLIFFIFSIPSLMAFFAAEQTAPINTILQSAASSHVIQNNIHPSFSATNTGLFDLAFNKIMIGGNLIVAMAATIFLFFLGARKKLQVMIKNSRPERIFHFFLLFLFGSALVRTAWFANWVDVQSYLLAFISFVFAWMFCVCQNDIYDEEIDSISNKDRPVVSKDLSKYDMEVASKIFLFFTFLSAYASSHYVLFFVSLFLFVYYIYSNPPLRLKRFVIINSFLVSLACLAVIEAGFFLINNNKNILAFPPGLVLAIIIFFSAVTNIRDIKDYEGDKTSGIKTLPVLLGLNKSKKLIAGIICFFFLLIPWYFNAPILFIPSIVASVFSWYFTTKENYVEWKGFMVYMAYLVLIIGVFIFR